MIRHWRSIVTLGALGLITLAFPLVAIASVQNVEWDGCTLKVTVLTPPTGGPATYSVSVLDKGKPIDMAAFSAPGDTEITLEFDLEPPFTDSSLVVNYADLAGPLDFALTDAVCSEAPVSTGAGEPFNPRDGSLNWDPQRSFIVSPLGHGSVAFQFFHLIPFNADAKRIFLEASDISFLCARALQVGGAVNEDGQPIAEVGSNPGGGLIVYYSEGRCYLTAQGQQDPNGKTYVVQLIFELPGATVYYQSFETSALSVTPISEFMQIDFPNPFADVNEPDELGDAESIL